MVARTTPEQLEKLQSYGFTGEGELSELIEWLEGDSFLLLKSDIGWNADNIKESAYADTPLEACYNLAVAIKREKL